MSATKTEESTNPRLRRLMTPQRKASDVEKVVTAMCATPVCSRIHSKGVKTLAQEDLRATLLKRLQDLLYLLRPHL